MTGDDEAAVDAFYNFLSWGAKPSLPGSTIIEDRDVPPAWWAYAMGATRFCPPVGTL
jgi:hypothetical protein